MTEPKPSHDDYVPIDDQMLDILLGAIWTVIDHHLDDYDARPFAERIVEADMFLRDIRIGRQQADRG